MGNIQGLDIVVNALKKSREGIINAASKGLLQAGLHLEARGKSIAPLDTGNLENSIAADTRVKRGEDYLRVVITCKATNGSGKGQGAPGEVYSEKVHENMDYDGPNVGGARTQNRGPKTLARPTSPIEPSDGSAGGKFLERPMRNKPEQYRDIISAVIKKYLSKGKP